VSSIQSSGDVTVTDTQTGTVSDGEFLKNSGGNLTGGTVETEPNVPAWEEDANSPFTGTTDPSGISTISLAGSYDEVLISATVNAEPNTDSKFYIQLINGSECNGTYYVLDGQKRTGITDIVCGYVTDGNTASGTMKINGKGSKIEVQKLPIFNTPLRAGVADGTINTDINGERIETISFGGSESISYTYEIYGRDLA
jgi:hypothetical protein